MDITQIVIIISLIAVASVIVACGVWLVMLLKELKITITKTNSILDDTKLITSSVATPVSSISDFVMGFKNGISVFNSLFKKDGKSKE
jgi:hypothetical protein